MKWSFLEDAGQHRNFRREQLGSVNELDDDEIKQTAPSLMCFLMSQEILETIDSMNFFLKGNYENSKEITSF